MQQETISIDTRRSGSATFTRLVISVRQMSPHDWADLVVGYPGQPNVKQRLQVGDAALYETPQDGGIEVRLVAIFMSNIELLVTQISPRPGFRAAIETTDATNSSFTSEEALRIAGSMREMSLAIEASGSYSQEQLGLVNRKLDEMTAAAGRMGRKDWTMYVAGTLTSIVTGAAFSPEQAASLLDAANAAFSWLFSATQTLLT
jgi:hypothetical protein